MTTEYILILTATASKEDAQSIANAVVGARMASSTNILGPAASTYWWQEKMQVAQEEWFCVIRTTMDHYAEVESTIKSLHSYEEPGIIALPIVAGSASYLSWIKQQTHPHVSKQEAENIPKN